MSPASSSAQRSPLLVALGEKIRSLRHQRGLTMRVLAQQSGLSERFVSDLEAGRANISVLNLAEVAQVLGVRLTSLLEQTGPEGAPRKVVSLLGLRGAGKSTVGPKLASALGTRFHELDRLVETEAGMLLPEIFSIHGEEYYRRVELVALKRFLSTHQEGVLATGGGLVSNPEAFELLRTKTFTVWLKATPEEHWQRVVQQGDLRPIQNRPQAMNELRRRLKEREPLYGMSDLTCSTTARSVDDVVQSIAQPLTTG